MKTKRLLVYVCFIDLEKAKIQIGRGGGGVGAEYGVDHRSVCLVFVARSNSASVFVRVGLCHKGPLSQICF